MKRNRVSKPLRKALTGAFRLNLTLQVTQLALGTTNVHNVLLLQAELTGIETKAPNPLQHFSEHSPAHHHLSKLVYQPPGMTHQSPTYLDESRLNTCQKPAPYRFWQSQPSEEVAQVVGEYKQPQPHLVGNELVT